MFNVPMYVLNNINHKNHITNLANQNRYNTIDSNINKITFQEHFKFLSLDDNDINEDLNKKVGE